MRTLLSILSSIFMLVAVGCVWIAWLVDHRTAEHIVASTIDKVIQDDKRGKV